MWSSTVDQLHPLTVFALYRYKAQLRLGLFCIQSVSLFIHEIAQAVDRAGYGKLFGDGDLEVTLATCKKIQIFPKSCFS